MDEEAIEGAGKKGKAKADAAPETPKKPYGQNPGDIVDQTNAVGGRFKALGAGQYERLAD